MSRTFSYHLGPHTVLRSAANLLSAIAILTVSFAGTEALAQSPSADVLLSDGTQLAGTITKFEIDSFSIAVDGADRPIEYDLVESIVLSDVEPAVKLGRHIRLTDGSTIRADQCALVKDRLNFRTKTGGQSVTKRNVEAIVYRTQTRETLRRQLKEILADETIEADALVVLRGDDLNVIEGVVEKLTPEQATFSIDEQTAEVPIAKLDAISFFSAAKNDFAAPLAVCHLADGSALQVRRMELLDLQVQLTLLSSDKLNIDLEEILSFDFLTGSKVLLSSLTPSTNDWRPLLANEGLVEHLRTMRVARANQDFSGNPLSLLVSSNEAGQNETSGRLQTFDNGFAIRGGGRLAFKLNGDYQTISGTIGFAPQASEFGKTVFRILADGNVALELPLEKLTKPDAANFDVALDGCRRMVIEVDYADGRSIGDILHLVDVKLQK